MSGLPLCSRAAARLLVPVCLSPPFSLLPLQPPASVDPARINLKSTIAVNYWCQTMNCSETQLRNAVLAVGTLPEDVRTYLAR